MKFKYFNSLGREPIMYQSYGNKLDLVSYTIDKLAENFEGLENLTIDIVESVVDLLI